MSLVEARELTVQFPKVRPLDGVTFALEKGEAVGLLGASGSGKSTLGKVLLRLIDATSGTVRFDGADLTRAGFAELLPYRRRMQMIFQDPYGSLNPRATVGAAIAEVLAVHRVVARERIDRELVRLLELVGLRADVKKKYPHELSGGQRQRVGIARAIAVRPELLVADEPVSSLDVSIRAQILNLLMDLREQLSLTLLLISHDLSVVEHVCERVLLLERGKIVPRSG